MPTYEPGELVMLALMLVALGVTVTNWRRGKAWSFARLGSAWFGLWLLASVLTVAENVVWYDWLNAVEHTCRALAAVLVLFAVKDFVELRRDRAL